MQVMRVILRVRLCRIHDERMSSFCFSAADQVLLMGIEHYLVNVCNKHEDAIESNLPVYTN